MLILSSQQIPHQLVGVPLNYNVTLECFTEAHPTSLNYWTREDGNMIHDSKKYRLVFGTFIIYMWFQKMKLLQGMQNKKFQVLKKN